MFFQVCCVEEVCKMYFCELILIDDSGIIFDGNDLERISQDNGESDYTWYSDGKIDFRS